MLQQYRHIIWDWNGTLINDAWLCLDILNDLLRKRSKGPITLQQYQNEFDFPVKDFYAQVGFDFAVEPFEALASEFFGKYSERCFECKLQDHAINVLESFRDRGLKQSLLSAYHKPRLEEAVDFFNIRPFFTEIFGLSNYHAAGKVAEGRLLIEKSGNSPDQILLIGDTVHDYEVAQAVGIDCILTLSGHNSRQRLQACRVKVLDSLAELLPDDRES